MQQMSCNNATAQQFVTPAAYAKSRGLARSTVSRQIAAGKIPTHGKLLDPVEADTGRDENLHAPRGGAVKAARNKPSGTQKPAPAGPARDGNRPNLAKAQLAHEIARAKRASLLVGQLEGTLVDARKVELVWSSRLTDLRNRLLMIEETIGSRFGEECRVAIRSEIRRALTELSGGSDGPAAA